MPDVAAVYRQVGRVTAVGGIYISQHKQPTSLQAAAKPATQGYEIVDTSDGPAVQFEGDCLLQPDDTWDLRYLTNR